MERGRIQRFFNTSQGMGQGRKQRRSTKYGEPICRLAYRALALRNCMVEYDLADDRMIRGQMTKIDQEKERQRLASLYAGMSDLELRKVGENPRSLTDWAFEALREEMNKRDLNWSGNDMPLPSQMVASRPIEDDLGNRPIVLRRYRDMPEAFVAKSLLEDAGIESFLQDDNVVRMDWFWSDAIGGIKLVVRQKDAEESEKLLSEPPGDVDETGDTLKQDS